MPRKTAERGEPLTGDVLTGLYGDILKKYYGHDKEVCHIEDLKEKGIRLIFLRLEVYAIPSCVL